MCRRVENREDSIKRKRGVTFPGRARFSANASWDRAFSNPVENLPMTFLARLPLLGLIIAAGCSSPAPRAPGRKGEEPFRTISKGMTKDEVLGRVGRPDPRRERPEIWDYPLGGPQDPVYRFIFEAERVVHIKRFDGYAVVAPSGEATRAPYGLERP
jgi:hypothetical protein